MRSGSSCMFLIFTTSFLLASTFANGARIGVLKKIVKTIVIDGGEIVDCVNMHKQPAFTHPLLVNHTIQKQPSTKTNELGSNNEWSKLNQSWHKYGRCPHGSIPITRHHNSNHQPRKKYAPSAQNPGHQYAVIQANTSPGTIYGLSATLNVWDPTVSQDGFSLSQVWLTAGSGAQLNTMEAGWHVYPQHWNGDSQPRMFIYWTRDGYQSTGCYDVANCPGFVQTNNEFLIGGSLDSSSYDAQQSELSLTIQKDTSSGNWWLYVSGNPIGYWPQNIFTSIANVADVVQWGGEVYYPSGVQQTSSNQMGSGLFPDQGYKKSCYTRAISYIDTSNSVIQPSSAADFGTIIPTPQCYNLNFDNSGDQLFLYFGGPGCAGNIN